jgi:hypothetical protein
VAGGLFAGFATRSEGIARAEEPPLVVESKPPTEDANVAKKRVMAKLDQLARQKVELDQLTADLNSQLAKFDAALLENKAAAELGNDLAIVITEGGRGLGWSRPPYTVREVINGKVGEMQCYEQDILRTYLTRAFNDPKGPRKIRIYADQNFSHDQIYKLFAVCAQAGYQKARFILPEAPWIASGVDWKTGKAEKVERGEKEKEIELTKYAPKKPR